MSKVSIKLIKLYQKYLSPKLAKKGLNCRFYPTCSEYSILAYKKYGFIKGTIKTLNRLFRCNPKNLNSCIDFPQWSSY